MINKVLIKLAECVGRAFLIGGKRISRPPVRPKEDYRRSQPRRGAVLAKKLEIVGILFLYRVDEDQIEGVFQLRYDVQRFPTFNANTFAHSGAGE